MSTASRELRHLLRAAQEGPSLTCVALVHDPATITAAAVERLIELRDGDTTRAASADLFAEARTTRRHQVAVHLTAAGRDYLRSA